MGTNIPHVSINWGHYKKEDMVCIGIQYNIHTPVIVYIANKCIYREVTIVVIGKVILRPISQDTHVYMYKDTICTS